MEEPEELTFQFLREITEDFSEERKVGEGAFGKVYKGVTKHGEDVAVKILRDVNPDLDYRQFRNEFYNLTKAKHDNIVQFIGYCYETEKTRIEYNGRTVLAEKTHRALCFEFVHNGSLQKHLSDESCGLDWHTRYRIIKGTCEGLKYIHEDMGESLLHLDLKPDNILLDKNMVPKISDFGLSRIFGDELTRTTRSPLGTIGYQPPEYIERGEISEKFDIFSLGVVILSIVVGPNGYSKYLNKPLDEFIDQVQRNWRKRWQVTCSGDLSFEACCCQVETCTQIALDCLEKDNKKRPDIVKIIKKLNKIETGIDKLPQKRRKTVSGMTMHNEMKRAKKHKMISDQHQHSNFMIRSKRNESESNNTKETSLDVEKELIVGREEKKKRMASSLESMSEKIVILPIYGIGGIGKTTFARLIYNDKNFKYYSQVWVYVSPRFDLCKIGNSIISQLSGEENQANELQLIKSRLTKLFSRKKILIVLDDLWENNTIQLEDLKDMLTPGDKTIVLVTTRSAHIAQKICSNIEPYKIESLSDEMCWNIIKQKSGFEATHENEELVGIGKEIARKCGGVALAAQTLGSMLQSMKYDEWMTVKDSDIWNETISEDTSLPNHVLASLKLSYAFSMDDYLKSCFTYCAIFPKGYKIIKYDLIYQWISLGFIKPTKILSTLQLSEKYIEHLLGLTFLQHSMSLTTYRMYGEHDTVFTMHDLVHDLAISLLGDNILDQSKQGNTRGSSFCYALLTDCSKPLESCTASPAGLRALRFLDCRCTELHGAAFEPAESLRVLDLSECSVQKLPSSICRLKQLRYLNAPRIRDQFVPECITTLSNLRYLSLCGSFAILALPESIGEMEGLVHLDLSGCMGIEKLPESFVDLKSLEHLDFTNCKNVTGVSQCLARLTKLQYLNLSNCKNIGHIPGALGCLTELRYLNLSDCSYLSGNKFSDAEFLGSLTKLKYLNLYSRNQLHIIRLPEALGRLTELKYLNLSHHCSKGKLPASFGNLRNLVHLDLSWCSFHQDVAAVLNGLTTLQYLDLSNCSGFYAMEGKLEVFGNLSELRYLKLGFCNELIRSLGRSDINCLLQRICTLTNLEYLDLCGNNNIFSIPETLSNLRKLHTLDLSFCTNLQRLPTSISEIDSLKFLYTMECRMLDQPTVPQCKMASGISPYDYVIRTGDGKRSYPFKWKHEKHLGRLKITKLENVRSAKEVAQAINLMKSEKITGLTLKWTKDAERFMDDAEILKELDPPYRISEFRLQGYNSVSFPSWLMPLGAYLPRLVSIAMWDLPNCNHLPPLGQLPNLEWLEIRGMDSIKKIDADLYGGTPAFPRLVHFRIHYMESLEEWDTAYPNNDDGLNEPVFPCLISAEIRYCPRLSFKPRPPRSIKTLLVDRSEVMLTSSWENRGHVSASAATRLQVECCAVPLHQWSLLHHLPSLQHLRVLFCSDLTCSSPDFLGGLTSLQSLTVKDCGRITSLPERLGDLASLTKLKICDCKGIKSLPDTIQKLTCLLRLEISGCPELVRWSESEENKMKLTHIEQRVFVRNYDGSGTDGESENEGFEVFDAAGFALVQVKNQRERSPRSGDE